MNRDETLSLFEEHRPDYLADARQAARRLLQQRATITIDDVRQVCPPPPGIDPRVMGAVFNTRDFEPIGYTQSRRKTCHGRPIRMFRLRRHAC